MGLCVVTICYTASTPAFLWKSSGPRKACQDLDQFTAHSFPEAWVTKSYRRSRKCCIIESSRGKITKITGGSFMWEIVLPRRLGTKTT
jgi:hypothetical protein